MHKSYLTPVRVKKKINKKFLRNEFIIIPLINSVSLPFLDKVACWFHGFQWKYHPLPHIPTNTLMYIPQGPGYIAREEVNSSIAYYQQKSNWSLIIQCPPNNLLIFT